MARVGVSFTRTGGGEKEKRLGRRAGESGADGS